MVSEFVLLLRLDSTQVAWEVVLSVPDNERYDERIRSLDTSSETDSKHHMSRALSPSIPLRLSQGASAPKINLIEGAT